MSRVTTHPKVTTFRPPETGGFAFTEASWQEAEFALAKYPPDHKASAVMPLLWIAQRQNEGHLSKGAIEYVAQILEMAPIRVHEIASFYTMYNLEKPGKYQLQICRTTPCMLRGADDILSTVKAKLGIGDGEVTEDGMFSLMEVECLGACCNAPMMQVNNEEYFEDLTPEIVERLIDDWRAGKTPTRGSQKGRKGSEPESGLTTLKDVKEYGVADGPYANGEFVPAEVQNARAEAAQAGNEAGNSSEKGSS
ncbi:complex I 24 kDa subunit family protein [Rhodovibrio salinarum]|uniref:NAD(P)H-dependent oxidoreductase subunit E n=1 Tax=Rhodovibrio salinarum TaxID=1087 RepID=A0A934QIY4_9PROT|nr:NAD(P)H-dependent oxidoreductase subunit E [Rhodovibrio salinarum]MBK1697668.1 NAD(P)H-dependent oxidoreductase subunit E [Rhodovibrio salinarum]